METERINYSSYSGCTCHQHPPCVFCMETAQCTQCGNIYDLDDIVMDEITKEPICIDCCFIPNII